MLLAVELCVDLRRQRGGLVVETEHERAPERTGAHGQPLAVVPRQALRDALGDDAGVARHRFVDAGARVREDLGVGYRHPGVMPDVRIDVGRNESRDRRVMRCQTQPEARARARSASSRGSSTAASNSAVSGAHCGSSHSHAAVLRTCSTRTEFSIPCFKNPYRSKKDAAVGTAASIRDRGPRVADPKPIG